jgi:type VI secretion system protein ImpM
VPAEIVNAAAEAPGCYGKLPARGDFITRHLGRGFVDAWDDWLQQAILASRDTLGPRWLDIYLTSPIWRFALGDRSCGPNTVLGVVIPSVDKVGRYFPLMLGREAAPGLELTGLIAGASAWYQAVEDIALAALAPEFSLDALERPIPLDLGAPSASAAAGEPLAPPGLYIPLDPGSAMAELSAAHGPVPRRRTLWWTSGSEHVASCLLICPGLPLPRAFAAMLDGDWKRDGWLGPQAEADATGASEAAGPSGLQAPDP